MALRIIRHVITVVMKFTNSDPITEKSPWTFVLSRKDLGEKSGKVIINSSLQSPPGTILWHCSKCGAVLPGVDQDRFQVTCNYYIKHPDQYNKVTRKVDKEIGKAL